MAKHITITELKKQLKQLNNKDLLELICDLYKSDEKAKEIICTRFLGNQYTLDLLEEYKEKMFYMFFPKAMYGSPSLKAAKALIKDFKNIGDDEMMLDLLLHFVECGTEFTNTYGDVNASFYDSLCKVFDQYVDKLNLLGNEAVYKKFKKRIAWVINESSGIGWGYGDFISEKAYQIEWLEDE